MNKPQRGPKEIFDCGVSQIGSLAQRVQISQSKKTQHLQTVGIWVTIFTLCPIAITVR
jgi:hypothetical protein